MKLARYRELRDPAKTSEPFGADPPENAGVTLAGPFSVHLHAASRSHFDLRLPIGGVLASFAVPKGPSLDPDEKRFAARTEDHPIEYLDFEGVIPEGHYGAGPMIVWDRGRVRYLEGPAEEEIERGKIDFELRGHKLKGRFALVRMKTSDKEWLFFKKPDAFASKTIDITSVNDRSVLSGLTAAELAKMPEVARSIEEEAAAMGAVKRRLDPKSLVPMLCMPSGAPEAGEGWLYELKLDGVRAVATKDGHSVSIRGRSLRDTTGTYPEITRALSSLAATRAVVDGEIIAFDDAGLPSFQRLGRRIHLTRAHDIRMAMADVPVVYVLFDILVIGDFDVTGLPLSMRKRLLARLLPAPGVLRVLDSIEGDGRALYAFCRERKLEGVVAKRTASPYRPGARSPDWVKMKCERDDEFVVVGYTRGEGARERLGALDIATWEGDKLVCRGKVGSGLDEAAITLLLERLAKLAAPGPTADGQYQPAPKGRTHVRPEIVVSVQYFGWSEAGNVWHPSFRGIRDDVDLKQCTAAPKSASLDVPAPKKPQTNAPELIKMANAKLDLNTSVNNNNTPNTKAKTKRPAKDKEHKKPQTPGETRVAITNAQKILWPEDGITKGELCDYYREIAPAMLPYLLDRPVMMVRYPNGIDGKSFYQWNAPAGAPSWIRTCRIKNETGTEFDGLLIDDPDGLSYLANLAAIPIHILASKCGTQDQCDFLTIDFDLKSAPFASAVTLALALRDMLEAIDLAGFPKTSGQTGLHVFVPLGESTSFATARALADLLGHLLVESHPDIATMERSITKRGDRVYVDTGQTGPFRTIAAPYSVRAQRRAPVSTPLRWEEVSISLDPSDLHIRSVIDRIKTLGDPMKPMLSARPDVAAAVRKLGEQMRNGPRMSPRKTSLGPRPKR